MIVFYQLLLAHLISDFPLQFNKIYQLKMEGKKGVLLHCSIAGVMSGLALIPYLADHTRWVSVWISVIILGIGHSVTDYGKIWVTSRTNTDNLWMFLLDQAFHIILIGLVSVGLVSTLFEPVQPIINPKIDFFFNESLLIKLCGYTIGSFATVVLNNYLLKLFFKDYTGEIFKFKIKVYGIIERITIITLFLLEGRLYLFIPLILLLRLKIPCFSKQKFMVVDIISGTIMAIACGIWLKYLS